MKNNIAKKLLKPEALLNMMEDLEEAKKETEILRKRIEFILESTKTNIDIIDSDFNLIYVDPMWEKIYGSPKGRKCYEYFAARNRPCPGCGIPQALKTKKKVVTEEVLPKEGNRPVQVITVPFKDEKGKWLVAEVNVDITERKKAEKALKKSKERLSAFMDSAPDAFGLFDSKLNLVDVNKIGLRMFPAGTKKENIIGKNIREIGTQQYNRYLEVVKTGKPFFMEDVIALPKFGKMHVAVNAFKVGDGLGIIARDITERKKTEEKLLKQKEKYEKEIKELKKKLKKKNAKS